MARVCHSCGKRPAFGQRRSHSMVATKRRFDPNLQKVRILEKGAPLRAYGCTRCLKAGKVTKAKPRPPRGELSVAPPRHDLASPPMQPLDPSLVRFRAVLEGAL